MQGEILRWVLLLQEFDFKVIDTKGALRTSQADIDPDWKPSGYQQNDQKTKPKLTKEHGNGIDVNKSRPKTKKVKVKVNTEESQSNQSGMKEYLMGAILTHMMGRGRESKL
ncbi:hypothetical protein Tco_1122720 [Tanacetum coccineum]|uniref:Uncharacterized protein n=1 Tax=Tanacetum coccineum TaxID=301880 RepID=A0ABQ5J306_9ASTR